MSHFARDCVAHIAPRSTESADSMFWSVVFVLLTIRQPFWTVPRMLEDVRKLGADSRYLFAHKLQAFHYASANRAALLGHALAFKDGKISLEELICHYMAVPGLGLVKASFLAQMTVANGACLDAHNLDRLGLSRVFFKTPKTLKPATTLAKVKAYNALWRIDGDSGHWWDSWCDHVASLNPKRYPGGGAEVSRLHRVAVGAE